MEPVAGTLAEAVKTARQTSMSMRELARRSGVSAAQISRIEAGDVERPSVETLTALARALELNPIPLMILGGYIGEEEARERLGAFLADGTELWEAWTQQGSEEDYDYVAEMRAIVEDPNATRVDLGEVARNLFLTPELEETAWHDSLLLAGAPGPEAKNLRELAQLWPALTSDRRRRVMECLRDQVELSRAEWKRDVAEMQAQTTAAEET